MLFPSKRIKIVTSYSGFGGSTISLIELCEAFCREGHNCTMYGPNMWPKIKQFFHIDNLKFDKNDYIIQHLIELPDRPDVRKIILTCHEKSYFNLNQKNINGYDCVRFVSQSQKDWHGIDGVVIPNIIEIETEIGPKGVAGVIGSISERKQTHLAIEAALKDNHKVMVYGPMKKSNINYINKYVRPLLDLPQVDYKIMESREKMYSSVSSVYSASVEECASRVLGECKRLGIPFYNIGNVLDYEMWNKKDILKKWHEIMP